MNVACEIFKAGFPWNRTKQIQISWPAGYEELKFDWKMPKPIIAILAGSDTSFTVQDVFLLC